MAVYDRPGQSPPFLFLHGTGCDAADFADVLDALPGLRAIRLEFRGHGRSDPSPVDFTIGDFSGDVVLAVRRLGLSRAVLVGHSLGGMVGIEVARRCPAVSTLVLLEGWTRLSVVPLAFGPSHAYGALSSPRVREIQERSRLTKARVPEPRWHAFWRTVSDFDGKGSLSCLPIRVHEVYGDAGALPDARSRLAVPDRPNITWAWIAGAGHYLPIEAPEEVAALCAAAVEP
jgi:pimeloyl-ACP methyl ester carboxylesterase